MNIKIAVVEDDREISRILKDLLENNGYEVLQAFALPFSPAMS